MILVHDISRTVDYLLTSSSRKIEERRGKGKGKGKERKGKKGSKKIHHLSIISLEVIVISFRLC